MDEARVKAVALSRVREAVGRGRKPVVTAEFTLGDSGVRADIALFADDLIGLEIKTERDSLRRLQTQMAAYSRYFHRTVAIVAEVHLRNITPEHLQGASLWSYDARGVLRERQLGVVHNVRDEVLYSILTQAERRKYSFAEAMEARYGDTSRAFWRSVARRSIRPEDLTRLSRFADGRELARRFAAERNDQWSQWLAAQTPSLPIPHPCLPQHQDHRGMFAAADAD